MSFQTASGVSRTGISNRLYCGRFGICRYDPSLETIPLLYLISVMLATWTFSSIFDQDLWDLKISRSLQAFLKEGCCICLKLAQYLHLYISPLTDFLLVGVLPREQGTVYGLYLQSLKSVVWRSFRWRWGIHRTHKIRPQSCFLCWKVRSEDANTKVMDRWGYHHWHIAQKLRWGHFWDANGTYTHRGKCLCIWNRKNTGVHKKMEQCCRILL